MGRIIAIIQARMGSSRLPGKVLKEISGKPMLVHVVERVRKASSIDQVVVATTTDASDDAIETLCHEKSYLCYRGSLHDVLDRFYQTARLYQADSSVRITADCPLLDVEILEKTVRRFIESHADFAANRLPPPFKRTYPIGLDVEVCTSAALQKAWNEAREKYEREHVMPYLYQVEGRFKVVRVENDVDYGNWRLTVDTPEDLEMVRKIFDHFKENPFGWMDVIHYLEAHPEIARLNAGIVHKTVFDVDHRAG